MAFGININFVPITPGGFPRSEPAPLAPENNSLNNLKHLNLEAYKRELIALRERDMAITKPTQLEYFARPRRPTVQIASPPTWLVDNDFDFDLGLFDFEQPFPPFDQYLFTSPTDTELDACDYTYASNIYQLNELVDAIYPNGLPSDFDSWDVYRERPEPSEPVAAEDAEDAMCFDDDAFLKSLEEFESIFGTATTLTSTSEEEPTSPSSPPPASPES